MNFEEAEVALRAFAKLDVPEQQFRRVEIIEVFEIFWRSNPKRAQFGEVCSHLVLAPEMLWIMVKTG